MLCSISGEGFRAKSSRGIAKHFGVRLVTQDFHDSSSYSRLMVVDHHAVHQDEMDVGMLSDPIHHLLVIFHGNIDEYSHGLPLCGPQCFNAHWDFETLTAFRHLSNCSPQLRLSP